MRNGKSILFLYLLLSSVLVHGQESLPVDQIEVIKHFDARLIETERIAFRPQIPEADTSPRSFTYEIPVLAPQVAYEPPQIKPLALRPEAQPKAYNGYLRFGYGPPHQVLADLSYVYHNGGPLTLSARGYHHSANEKKTPLKKQSESGGEISGIYAMLPEISIGGDIGYHIEKVNFYAVDPDDSTPYIETGRTFKTFTAGGQLVNPEPLNGNINYLADARFYSLKDDLGTRETGALFMLRGDKRFEDRHVLALDFIADLSKLKDPERTENLNNLSVLPSFRYNGFGFSAKAGVNFAAGDHEFYILPVAELAVQLARNRLSIFAQVDGGLYKNNYRALSEFNPFIHEQVDSIKNTVHRDYSIGARGIVRKIEIQGKFTYSTVKDLALYIQDFSDYRKFQPLYDGGTTYRIEGAATMHAGNGLDITASVSKVFYDLDNQEKAWHLPGFYASLIAQHKSLDDKLRLHGGFQLESGAPYRSVTGDVDKLKGIIDLSIGAEYYFIENIGAFIHLNNLLGRKAQRWQGYDSFGINGAIGIITRI